MSNPAQPEHASDPSRMPARRDRTGLVVLLTALAVVVGLLAVASANRDRDEATGSRMASSDTTNPGTTNSGASTSGDSSRASADASTAAGRAEELLALARRDPKDVAAVGDVAAPVVLIEYADYRCPFCAEWARTTRPALQELIDDGTLRIEFRDIPIFGEQSEQAALAARAAGVQGRFWQFHQAVFDAAPASGHPDLTRARLVEFARRAGVPDLGRFEDDLASPTLRQALERDVREAEALGISSTPAFVIGGEALLGAQPTELFLDAITRQAAAARG